MSRPPAPPDAAIASRPRPRVALESTLLLHGVPKSAALGLHDELDAIVRGAGAQPALVAVINGQPTVGVSRAELEALLSRGTPKLNTSSLGVSIFRGLSGATTVSTTMELAARAGVRVFATGGLGGVHRGYSQRLDISTDLFALTRFPVAVVASGCKSILDVPSTRELLETLGVPVIGWRTDRFPAFYQRDGGVGVDARFDDVSELGRFVRGELVRSGRGMIIANPVPEADEIPPSQWLMWLAEAEKRAAAGGAHGRDVTPALLAAVHEISGGATLRTNIALVKSNAELAGRVACEVDR